MAPALSRRLATLASGAVLSFFVVVSGPATAEIAAPAPAADEAGLSPQELLGKKIFEDARLSEPPGVSCASCHEASKAFQGNNGSPVPALAQGSRPGVLGKRNTPTLSYLSFAPRFGLVEEQEEEATEGALVPAGGMFWDGRADDFVAQVEGPLLEPREMNNPSKAAVLDKIKAGDYAGLARQVYGENVFSEPDAFEKIARAVVAFESTPRFHPFSSKFDDFLRGKAKLTKEEARGFALFKDKKKGNCLACHAGQTGSHKPEDWLFTDFTFDALGAPRNPDISDNKDPAFFDPGLCVRKAFQPLAPQSFVDGLCGQFKTPTLRNVAITGPYLHNGVFTSLRDVVAFYATRDTNPERWFPKVDGKVAKFNDLAPSQHENVNVKEVPYDRNPGEKPRLDDGEVDAIVAFLRTLTDRQPPAH